MSIMVSDEIDDLTTNSAMDNRDFTRRLYMDSPSSSPAHEELLLSPHDSSILRGTLIFLRKIILLLNFAREYDLNQAKVCELMKQHVGLELPKGDQENVHEEGGSFSACYRIELNLRHSLKPMYEVLFELFNTLPGIYPS